MAKKLDKILKEIHRSYCLIRDITRNICSWNVIPYALPTFKRAIREEKENAECANYSDKDVDKSILGILGVVGGLAGLYLQGSLYGEAAKQGFPEALLIPLITNIGSAIYENKRKAKQEAEKFWDNFISESTERLRSDYENKRK
jgi:hypothetical protein